MAEESRRHPQAQPPDSGSYSVIPTARNSFIVEEPFLNVIGPPTIALGIYRNGSYPGITINGSPGRTYTIQSTTNLVFSGSWTTITNLTATQSVTLWLDTSVNLAAGSSVPTQYYRVGLVP